MEFIFEHWYKIVGLLFGMATIIASPVVLYRWLKTRNELTEIQTFIKKNRVVREEIAAINAQLDEQNERIRALEVELHDEKLLNRTLEHENKRLTQINRDLRDRLDDYQNQEL